MTIDIPVPPFASREEHERFRRALALWIAGFDETGVGMAHMGLLGALELAADDSAPRLTKLELALVATTWFPVPWTLAQIVDAIGPAIPHFSATRGLRGRVKAVRWGYDPDFAAARSGDGAWVVHRSERGSTEVDATPSDDAALGELLLDELRVWHPYPFGWVVQPVPGLDDALPAARVRWSQRRALPYLDEWR